MIQLEKISKSYGGNLIFESIDLKIEQGETHVLMGDNGAGKTTLARILAGLEKPDSGSVIGLENQKDAHTMVIQQDFVIWPELTVAQNMSVAADKKLTTHWLETTGLSHLTHSKAGILSHGQKQRLSIARAMASRPRLLIIDEAFSYLDPVKSRDAIKWVSDALKSSTNPLKYILWITQSPQEAMTVADRLSIIEKGKPVITGLAEDIYNNPPSYNIAQLTGEISQLNYTNWLTCKNSLTYHEQEIQLRENQILTFRPEWCSLSPCDLNSETKGFQILASRFSPHGYISQISYEGRTPINIHTPEKPDPSLPHHLHFHRIPPVFNIS